MVDANNELLWFILAGLCNKNMHFFACFWSNMHDYWEYVCHIDMTEKAEIMWLASQLNGLACTHNLPAVLRAIISNYADMANVMTFDPRNCT